MKSKKAYLRMRLLCFYSAKHIIKNVNIFTDNICFFARLVLILHEQNKVCCMKSSMHGLWLSWSAPMEDSQQCHQMEHSSKAKQTKQHSLIYFNMFLGIPLQPLLLSL